MARASINDVAKLAGVSSTTVSHVINKTRFVSESTRQKVVDAIKALDYQPSAIARGLATKTSQAIGLVVSDITNPFWPAVILGVEHEIRHFGYHTIFCNTDEDPAQENDSLQLLKGRQTDGLLLAPTGVRSERLLKMAAAGLPIVLLDRSSPGLDVPLVCVDNEGGAVQVTKHLIEMGHTRIGVVGGIGTVSTQVHRINGYKRALKEVGIPVDDSLIACADNRFYTNLPFPSMPRLIDPDANSAKGSIGQTYPSAIEAVNALFDLPDTPTALFITNNQMTLATLQVISDRGLHCPDDISVVSFDDHDWAPLYSPPLTVVRQPTYELGKMAAQLLMKLINHEEIESQIAFPVELVIRESVKQII